MSKTTEQGYTAGPWHVATNPGGKENQPAFPSVRDSSGKPHGEDIVAMPLGDSETVKANARLIAAAPDLLEACQEAIDHIDAARRISIPPIPKDVASWLNVASDILKAAIAKATGE